MQSKIILIAILVISTVSEAIVTIPQPDMSNTDKGIINAHKKLKADFDANKDKLNKIKLGTAYGNLGMFYQAHEFHQSAKASYINAKESSPFDFKWPYLLGFVESTLGNFDSAIQNFKTVLEINQDYLPAKIRWADLELEQGRFDVAQKLFVEVLDVAPRYAKAFVGLGTINMQLGNSQKAIEYYQKALQLQPNANQLNYLISQAYSSLGNKEQANMYMQNQGQRSVIMYDKILQEMRLHSVSSSYYSQAAINAYMNGDFALAEKLIEHAIKLDPNNINPNFTLLNILVSTDRSNDAIKLASELLIKHPDDDRLSYSLGVINEINKKDIDAAKWYELTLKLNQNHNSAHYALANTYMRLNDYEKALVALRLDQKQNPENPYSYYAEASILAYRGKCHEAIPIYLIAINKLSQENFRYLTAFVKTVAVCSNVDQQTRTDALNAARNMYLFMPTWQTSQALAMIEADFGNMQDAVDYQAQAIFQALTEKLSNQVVNDLKVDLELYKNEKKAIKPIKEYDINDVNPARTKSIDG